MTKFVAALIGFTGMMLGAVGLLLLSAVVAVLRQGKPLDVISTVLSLILIAAGLFALRAAWRRWRAAP